jgi:hypothetical protein
MEQQLRLSRRHTPACTYSYKTPLYDGHTLSDCTCSIVATGYLRNVVDDQGKHTRILNKALTIDPIRDWPQARLIRDQWLEWGQTTPPGDVDIERSENVSVAQAVEFWIRYQQETDQK